MHTVLVTFDFYSRAHDWLTNNVDSMHISETMLSVKLKFHMNVMSVKKNSAISIFMIWFSRRGKLLAYFEFDKSFYGKFLQYCYSEISQSWYSDNFRQILFIHTTFSDTDLDPSHEVDRNVEFICTQYNWMRVVWAFALLVEIMSLLVLPKCGSCDLDKGLTSPTMIYFCRSQKWL